MTVETGGALSPLVPRRYLWFLALTHAALAAAYTLGVLAKDPSEWLEFGKRLGVLMVAFVFVRSASKASSPWVALLRMGAAGACSAAVSLSLFRWLIWRNIWPLRHDLFWRELPVEVLLVLLMSVAAGLWWSLFAIVVQPPKGEASIERSDRAAVGVAIWSALPLAMSRVSLVKGGNGVWDVSELTAWALLAVLAAGRIAHRRRWLRDVADGRIAGWRIVDSADESARDLPLLIGGDVKPAGVLARTSEGTGEPFRHIEHAEPVALVGAPPGARDRTSPIIPS